MGILHMGEYKEYPLLPLPMRFYIIVAYYKRGGVGMATSSITKDFFVKDRAAFDRLKKELESKPARKQAVESPSLKKGREKLATFVFR